MNKENEHEQCRMHEVIHVNTARDIQHMYI